ncbi:MAG: ribonuclease P protein component [Lactobacillaceae bacterium]|jgi:ribonuclease P protein component|nr:ribonuclease P protein component [Lactobacillaceae bacterium]
MTSFETLKKRSDFLRVAKGIKVVTSSIILQAAQSLCTENKKSTVGFTTSKKIGPAVVRNRARRRLRALAREFFPQYAMKNFDYVLIGRHNTAGCDFYILKKDIKYGLEKIRGQIEKNGSANQQN